MADPARKRPASWESDGAAAKKPKDAQQSTSSGSLNPAELDRLRREVAARAAMLKAAASRTPSAVPTPAPVPQPDPRPPPSRFRLEETRLKVQQALQNVQMSSTGATPRPFLSERPRGAGLKIDLPPELLNTPSSSTGFRRYNTPLLPPSAFATVKANMRVPEKPVRKETKPEKPGKPGGGAQGEKAKNPYLEPALIQAVGKTREARPLKFVQPGKYVQIAKQVRAQEMLEMLKKQIEATVKKTGMDVELDLVSDHALRIERPPDAEWWDTQLLETGSYEDVTTRKLVLEGDDCIITNLIQHPIPVQPPAEPGQPPPKPVMLTEKERKKLRRQRRAEALKEKQEKIRLGLLPPEQPKVKISNLMRVLGAEAVQDPTKIEQQVRAQIAQRLASHKRHNESMKLTDEQKKQKKRNKLMEDTSKVVQVAVFRVKNLSHPLHRNKIDFNAQQNFLTGVAILHEGLNLVVVEGGPKAIRRYKKLMLRRINWSDATAADNDEVGEGPSSKDCVQVWEGEVQRRFFDNFRFKKCDSDTSAKQFLEKFGAPHYWEAARNYSDVV
ncbi:U4/U6 small nuclear ribonucleoprotein Prp3 [Cladochytrium replicatum]|nr:U4/U6 small nuclear ribonucleoprotein Prp3 [Cladochytrium replicatum]